MEKKAAHKKARDEQTPSDQEIWWTIRYLDPDDKDKNKDKERIRIRMIRIRIRRLTAGSV